MFYGRKEELVDLSAYLNSDKQENIIIYGRRRIGKSELIKETIKMIDKKFIYYQAKQTTIIDNLRSLSKIVSETFKLGSVFFDSFETLFNFIFKQEEIIFILDEYPYLRDLEEGLDSILQKVIDENGRNSTTKLVLLGSYIDVMANLNSLKNPLYGRITKMMFIKEMNYFDSSLFYADSSLETKMKYYSVFGGVPYYNKMIDQSKSFEENIKRLIISDNSPLADYIEIVLFQELRKINNANSVFLTIARGINKFNDILSFQDKDFTSAQLSNILNILIKMDLIKKTIPINEKQNSRKTYYNINDNFVDFFYRYIYRYKTERNIMNHDDFYEQFIKDDFLNYFIPLKFEKLAEEFLVIKNKQKNFNPPLEKIGKYWYNDPINKINGEFDLVSLDKLGYIVFEAKYTDKKIDDKVLNRLKHQLKVCNVNYYKLGFFSKTGFYLKDSEEYYLFTLEDIYSLWW